MKDAFGGSFILRVMSVFFAVFICFMSMSITISKTFRIKNNIVNILERSDPKKLTGENSTQSRVDEYLQKISYNYSNNQSIRSLCANDSGILVERGVCIVPTYNCLGATDSCKIDNARSVHYKVTAYIVMEFPLFNLGKVIPISGETKVVYIE